jgi:hypothetical protein
MEICAVLALGPCPAGRQPMLLSDLLAQAELGWTIHYRAWAPGFTESQLCSGYVNIPDVSLLGISAIDLLTGALRVVRVTVRDGLLRSLAPSDDDPTATLLLWGQQAGWGWPLAGDHTTIWRFRASVQMGRVDLLPFRRIDR